MPIRYADPIYARVAIPDSLRPVIESPVLTRLRNIRQLGFTLARYPGAVHTRFEHTVGTVAVMTELLTQFAVTDREEVERYQMAALLSEIGIYPLSYSARSVFKKYGHDKSEYAKLLYESYLQQELGLRPEEQEFVFDPAKRRADWFSPVTSNEQFAYLDPVKLASTIDYALRDGYYTGRYPGAFDYRYFSSLGSLASGSSDSVVRDSLYSLHRAVHALNGTYGDSMRRALSQVLARLTDRLVEAGFVDASRFGEMNHYLDLDDDRFLYLIAAAVQMAEASGDRLARAMYEFVVQRASPRVEGVKKEEIKADPHDTHSLQAGVASRLSVEPDQVFLLGHPHDTDVGFRVFGVDFESYADAIESDLFRKCTGLQGGLEELAADSDVLQAVIVEVL